MSPKPKKKVEPIREGDFIEFSLSQELPYPKGAATWVKAGLRTSVRPGETSAQAKERIVGFVTDWIQDQVNELIDDE